VRAATAIFCLIAFASAYGAADDARLRPVEPPHGTLIVCGGGVLPNRIFDEFVKAAGGEESLAWRDVRQGSPSTPERMFDTTPASSLPHTRVPFRELTFLSSSSRVPVRCRSRTASAEAPAVPPMMTYRRSSLRLPRSTPIAVAGHSTLQLRTDPACR
jgi:hypothetical protein